MIASRPLLACLLAALPFAAGCQKAQADTSPDPTPARRPALSAAPSAAATEAPAPSAEASAVPAAPAAAGPRTIKISAIGDCTLGGPYESADAPGSFSQELAAHGDDYRYPFANVLSVLAADDLTIANLETTLTTVAHAQPLQIRFKGKPAYTAVLKEGSVEVVNVANNHSYDFGPKGYDETLSVLRAAGIGVGGNDNVDKRMVKGVEVVNIGFTGGSLRQKAKMLAMVKEHKTEKNLVFVSFHWGGEGINAPNTVQIKLGRAAIDAGADLVLGSHPHVLQSIEEYHGKHIVYSLGNFVFGGNGNPADKDSMIYQETFTETEGRWLPTEQTILPVRISSLKNRNDYQPVLLYGEERARVLGRIKSFNEAAKR